MAKNGVLTSSTKGGRVEHADVIVKRAIRSGVNQTTSRVMDDLECDLECDLVETSSHAVWQGKVFSRSGKHKKHLTLKKEQDTALAMDYADGIVGICFFLASRVYLQ